MTWEPERENGGGAAGGAGQNEHVCLSNAANSGKFKVQGDTGLYIYG